jgi:hypothetical protein
MILRALLLPWVGVTEDADGMLSGTAAGRVAPHLAQNFAPG